MEGRTLHRRAALLAYAWQGLTAPARPPDDVCARLTAEVAAALADPAVQGRMREIGSIRCPAGRRSAAA